MNDIFVKNLETNISRLIEALKKNIDDVKESLPVADYTSIIDAISKIKLEKNDLSGIEETLKNVSAALEVIRDKKVETGKDEILAELKTLISTVKLIKIPEVNFEGVKTLLSNISSQIRDFRFPVQKEVQFPEVYPLPKEQLEFLISLRDTASPEKMQKMIELLEEIRKSSGGGGTDVVGIKNVDVNGRETRVNAATEETLRAIADSSFVSSNIDTADATNYYFLSFISGTTKWRINRLNKSTYVSEYAIGDSSIATAWTNRTTQTYSTIY